jgi:hypothetical protein
MAAPHRVSIEIIESSLEICKVLETLKRINMAPQPKKNNKPPEKEISE